MRWRVPGVADASSQAPRSPGRNGHRVHFQGGQVDEVERSTDAGLALIRVRQKLEGRETGDLISVPPISALWPDPVHTDHAILLPSLSAGAE